MGGSSQDTDLNGMHIRRVTPARSRILNGGGLQHRAVAYHRDVHDSHVPLHFP